MLLTVSGVVPDVIRGCIKESFRAFGMATSHLRALPDFLIIGAHRAGTTALHECLTRHPCVASTFPRVQHIKGVRFFDEYFYRGTEWYRSHFPTVATRTWLEYRARAPVLVGESSPYYLFHPLAAERAWRVVPNAQILVLLRNPIERAYSHWRRERRDGRETLPFEAAIAAEPVRLAGEEERIREDEHYFSYAHENFSYLAQGLYVNSLPRWLARYPREQVFIETSEAFLRRPQQVYDRVLRFLRLPPLPIPEPWIVNANAAAEPIAADTRARLRERIAPYTDQLEQRLGLHFEWN